MSDLLVSFLTFLNILCGFFCWNLHPFLLNSIISSSSLFYFTFLCFWRVLQKLSACLSSISTFYCHIRWNLMNLLSMSDANYLLCGVICGLFEVQSQVNLSGCNAVSDVLTIFSWNSCFTSFHGSCLYNTFCCSVSWSWDIGLDINVRHDPKQFSLVCKTCWSEAGP